MAKSALELEVEKLRAENAQLTKRAESTISLKVSEKGALSLYGLGRFPVTLYHEQWTKVLDKAEDIRSYIAANMDRLKSKE